MTDKEVQKLRRADLIEILYYLRRENDELREENASLQQKLDTIYTEAIRRTAGENSVNPSCGGTAPGSGNTHKNKKKR
jgi:hypothetical protein